MDNLLSILVLIYFGIYIESNTDMHYTITNINMNTPTNTNNHLHIGINMYMSTNTNTYLHILVYISIHTVIINKPKIMNAIKHPVSAHTCVRACAPGSAVLLVELICMFQL